MAEADRRTAQAGRNRRPASLAPIVERIGPPLSRVPWSADIVAQSLEILAVTLHQGRILWLKPVHAPSLRVGLPRTTGPSDFVLEVIGSYPLTPRVVHSTSWRYEEGRVLLTYVVVVEPPGSLPEDSLEIKEVQRSALARGGSMAPPDAIGLGAVLEHALRHLSWLIHDDPAIANALADWSSVLDTYKPEPFRALS